MGSQTFSATPSMARRRAVFPPALSGTVWLPRPSAAFEVALTLGMPPMCHVCARADLLAKPAVTADGHDGMLQETLPGLARICLTEYGGDFLYSWLFGYAVSGESVFCKHD